MSEHDEAIANLVYDLHNALCRGDCDSFRAMVSAAVQAGIKLGEERGQVRAEQNARDWFDAKSAELEASLMRAKADAAALEGAKAEGAREEREAVVKWLHQTEDALRLDNYWDAAAEKIEAGEHRQ